MPPAVNTRRLPIFALLAAVVAPVLLWTSVPAVAQQTESASEVQAPEAYQRRLRSADSKIKKVVSELEARKKAENWSFGVGYTTALDRTPEELTGLKTDDTPPEIRAKQIEEAQRTYGLYRKAHPVYRRASQCQPSMKSFDWQTEGKVSPIKDQERCGTCWAFSAAAAYESSYLIENGLVANISEQDLFECAGTSKCDTGGTTDAAFYHIQHRGTMNEGADTYIAPRKRGCLANVERPFGAVAWAPLGDDYCRVIPTLELKKALCEHGPLVTSLAATLSFSAYTGGVYSQVDADAANCSHPNRHAIVITGWDDRRQAWRIKNSWGVWWGEQGFAWVRYGANRIGHGVYWVQAR